jgi:hypothetical protein
VTETETGRGKEIEKGNAQEKCNEINPALWNERG